LTRTTDSLTSVTGEVEATGVSDRPASRALTGPAAMATASADTARAADAPRRRGDRLITCSFRA
jgi:hypothetical protein